MNRPGFSASVSNDLVCNLRQTELQRIAGAVRESALANRDAIPYGDLARSVVSPSAPERDEG